MDKTIGILGGLGPLATVDIFHKIVSLTEANSDQDHIHILIDNNPGIPNRLNFLLSHGESPENQLIESAIKLELMGADVLIMPCNTAHYFYSTIKKNVGIDFINMIDETAKEIKRVYPSCTRIGLLATKGTYYTGIYDKEFASYEIEVIKPGIEDQQHIADLILAVKVGQTTFDLTNIYRVLDNFKKENIDLFVLGCTELPIAFQMFDIEEKFIDPTTVLACSAIRYTGKTVRTKKS